MRKSLPWMPAAAAALAVCLFMPGSAQEPDSSRSDYKPRTLSPAPGLQVVDQGQGVSVTQQGRGKLLVVADTWDFGYVPQDAHIMHRYVLQNVGNDTLFIEEVKPTCGCTVASLEKKELAPGEKVPVAISVGTAKYSGVLSKKVHVISSDADAPRYALSFKADVGPAPQLGWPSGSRIELGRVTLGEPHSARLTIANESGKALRIQIAEAPPSYLKARLSSQDLAPSATFDVDVETGADTPVGPFQASLTLDVSGARTSRLTIPITGVGVQN